MTATQRIRAALALLDQLDDEIDGGFDLEPRDRARLRTIRRIKNHVRRLAPPEAQLGLHGNPNAK
jgi:hypothetical protein